jgi:hypothetical protein
MLDRSSGVRDSHLIASCIRKFRSLTHDGLSRRKASLSAEKAEGAVCKQSAIVAGDACRSRGCSHGGGVDDGKYDESRMKTLQSDSRELKSGS